MDAAAAKEVWAGAVAAAEIAQAEAAVERLEKDCIYLKSEYYSPDSQGWSHHCLMLISNLGPFRAC